MGDLIGDPEKRHFLNEMTYGAKQIRGPEQGVVTVAKRMKDANGLWTPLGCVSRKDAKALSREREK